jgi:hypothetical protein
MIKALFFPLLLILGISTSHAQDLKPMGLSKEQVIKHLKLNKKIYKNIAPKKLNKFDFSEKFDSNLVGRESLYIENSLVWYTTPYRNFTNRYYFNNKGYCDSIAVIENACLDCAIIENDSTLKYFGLGIWKKVSENEFRSSLAYSILPYRKNGKAEKYALVKLTKYSLPANGSCRLWTATIAKEIDAKSGKEISYDRVLRKQLTKIQLIVYGSLLGSIVVLSLLLE